ncbi:uncharacterized protein EV420DRAFT_137340 [Desarmillaria tabescens]|uniref:Uncharacterized protein n=1 Tax=Armillaria tabescens TaxID=1929756 RepID=A0AA39TK62_ARMTA|nr:uncharacterized protein EV420DRAFT_137340 [Desarmillaria tabescens]KAK0461937.1 hypothetical protein EV420DRAFT_137340 [Desarmillaria tabescens]
MSTRPGPLREWPLERFLPAGSNLPPTANPFKSNRPHKRAHSPTPTPFSPTKRRILFGEGIFSPEKTVKSSLRRHLASPARFTEILQGPGSPAKKLDFGSMSGPSSCGPLFPSPESEEEAPSSSRHGLAPSPRLSSSSAQKERPASAETSHPTPSSIVTRSTSSTTPPPDHAIHYPGFDVYPDMDIEMLPSVTPLPPPDLPKDSHKENLPPRRRAKKASVIMEDGKPIAWSSDPKTQELQRKYMLKSTPVQLPPFPVTPKKTPGKVPRVSTSPTPRRYHTRSSDKKPTLTDAEKKRRRHIMEAETDEKAGGL